MKTWLTKLGIDDTDALAERLRTTIPRTKAPPELHNSIMNAVRATTAPSESGAERGGAFVLRLPSIRSLPAFAWVAAPALAALIVLLVWWGDHPSPAPNRPPSLAEASMAVDAGDRVPQAIPSAVVAPLSDELERVESDCDGGIQTVLASLP